MVNEDEFCNYDVIKRDIKSKFNIFFVKFVDRKLL